MALKNDSTILNDSVASLPAPLNDQVSFSLFLDGKLVNPDDAWLSVKSDFQLDNLRDKLKKAANIEDSAIVHLYRYSKSSDAYVLISNEDDIKAMVRAAKVKRHFLFNIVIAKWPSFRPHLSLKAVRKASSGAVAAKSTVTPSKVATKAAAVDSQEVAKHNAAVKDWLLANDVKSSADDSVASKASKASKVTSHSTSAAVPEVEVEVQAKTSAEASGSRSASGSNSLEDIIKSSCENFLDYYTSELSSNLGSVIEQRLDEAADKMLAKVTASLALRADKVDKEVGVSTAATATATTNGETPYYHSANCDSCHVWISGIRYKCLWCSDFDLCSDCMSSGRSGHEQTHSFVKIREREDIIPPAASSHLFHKGISCDGPSCIGCETELAGPRYTCTVCDDFDFCGRCKALNFWQHDKSHLLALKTTAASEPVLLHDEVEERIVVADDDEKRKDFCAELQQFQYSVDVLNPKMIWTLKNVGRKAWPKGTVIRPAYNKAAYASQKMRLSHFTEEVLPGESVTVDCRFVWGNDAIKAIFYLVTPSGVSFAKHHYYHGMVINGGILLPGSNDYADNKESRNEEANTEAPQDTDAEAHAEADGRDGNEVDVTRTESRDSSLDASEVKLFQLPKESPASSQVVLLQAENNDGHSSSSEMLSDSDIEGSEDFDIISNSDFSDS